MKIAVLCGGVSSEREVSLKSGAAVRAGLTEAGYDAVAIDVTSVRELLRDWPEIGADAAFIALHGGWGEDGRLQAALDAREIPYAGSSARSCAMCMDKDKSRRIMEENNILIPPGLVLRPSDKHSFREMIANWKKIVIKPASNGSTIGVAVTSDPEEAESALDAVWDIDVKAVVEKFIPGREFTIAVTGTGDSASALPIIEIRPRSGFYDYAAKYTKGETEYVCPAEINEVAVWTASQRATRIHALMECVAYSRIDFRFSEEDGSFFALEVNAAPGMTDASLVPIAAKARGWTFPKLLDNILRDSF